MDSKLPLIRPQQVSGAVAYGKRQAGQKRKPHKPFELGEHDSAQPPDAPSRDSSASLDRSVTAPDPDETGASLDVTA